MARASVSSSICSCLDRPNFCDTHDKWNFAHATAHSGHAAFTARLSAVLVFFLLIDLVMLIGKVWRNGRWLTQLLNNYPDSHAWRQQRIETVRLGIQMRLSPDHWALSPDHWALHRISSMLVSRHHRTSMVETISIWHRTLFTSRKSHESPPFTGGSDSFSKVAAIHLTVALVVVEYCVLEWYSVRSPSCFVLSDATIEYLLSAFVVIGLKNPAGMVKFCVA